MWAYNQTTMADESEENIRPKKVGRLEVTNQWQFKFGTRHGAHLGSSFHSDKEDRVKNGSRKSAQKHQNSETQRKREGRWGFLSMKPGEERKGTPGSADWGKSAPEKKTKGSGSMEKNAHTCRNRHSLTKEKKQFSWISLAFGFFAHAWGGAESDGTDTWAEEGNPRGGKVLAVG